MTPIHLIWSEAKVARLCELVAKSLSSATIANDLSVEFGEKTTRNAVIGKAHRIGLSLKGDGVRGPITVKPKKPRKVGVHPTFIQMRKVAKLVKVELPPVNEIDPLLHRDLMTNEGCKWPIDDVLYCGAALGGPRQSYCAAHAVINHKVSRPVSQKTGHMGARRKGRWS